MTYEALLGKTVANQILYYAQPLLVYDKMTMKVSADKGAYEYLMLDSNEEHSFEKVAPGADLPRNLMKAHRQITPIYEFAASEAVPTTFIDDGQYAIIDEISKDMGRAYARKLNSYFLETGLNGVDTSNQHTVTNTWDSGSGTPFMDIARMQSLVADDNYVLDVIAINPEARMWLFDDPAYQVQAPASRQAVESTHITDPMPILGMTMLTTQQIDRTKVLGVDSKMFAYYIERQPLKVITEKNPGRNEMIISASTRFNYAVVRPTAGGELLNILS